MRQPPGSPSPYRTPRNRFFEQHHAVHARSRPTTPPELSSPGGRPETSGARRGQSPARWSRQWSDSDDDEPGRIQQVRFSGDPDEIARRPAAARDTAPVRLRSQAGSEANEGGDNQVISIEQKLQEWASIATQLEQMVEQQRQNITTPEKARDIEPQSPHTLPQPGLSMFSDEVPQRTMSGSSTTSFSDRETWSIQTSALKKNTHLDANRRSQARRCLHLLRQEKLAAILSPDSNAGSGRHASSKAQTQEVTRSRRTSSTGFTSSQVRSASNTTLDTERDAHPELDGWLNQDDGPSSPKSHLVSVPKKKGGGSHLKRQDRPLYENISDDEVQEVAKLREQVKQLKNQLDASQEKRQSGHLAIATQIGEKAMEARQAREEATTLTAQLNEQKAARRLAEQEAERLHVTLQEAAAERQQLLSTHQAIQGCLLKADDAARALQEVNVVIQRELERERAQSQKLTSDLEESWKKQQEMQHELGQKQVQMLQLKGDVDEREVELSHVKGDLLDAHTQLQRSQQEGQVLGSELWALRSKLEQETANHVAMQRQNAQLQDSITTLQSQMKAKVESKEKELDIQQRLYAELKTQHAQATEQLQKSVAEQHKVQHSMEVARKELQSSTATCQQLEKRNEELISEVKGQEEQLHQNTRLRSELQHLQKVTETLEKLSHNQTQQIKELTAQKTALDNEQKGLRKSLTQSEDACNGLRQELKRLEEQKDCLDQSGNAARTEVQQLQHTIHQLRSTLQEKQSAIQEMQKTVESLQAQQHQEIQQLQARLTERSEQMTSIQATFEQFSKKTKAEHEQGQELMLDLRVTLKERERQLQAAQELLQARSSEALSKQSNLDGCLTELQAAKTELNQMSESLKAAEEERDTLRKQVREMKVDLEILQSRLGMRPEDTNGRDQRANAMKAELEQLKDQVKLLTQQLATATTSRDNARAQLQELKQKLETNATKQQGRERQLERQLKDAQKLLDEARQERDGLQAEIIELKGQKNAVINRMMQQLDQIRNQADQPSSPTADMPFSMQQMPEIQPSTWDLKEPYSHELSESPNVPSPTPASSNPASHTVTSVHPSSATASPNKNITKDRPHLAELLRIRQSISQTDDPSTRRQRLVQREMSELQRLTKNPSGILESFAEDVSYAEQDVPMSEKERALQRQLEEAYRLLGQTRNERDTIRADLRSSQQIDGAKSPRSSWGRFSQEFLAKDRRAASVSPPRTRHAENKMLAQQLADMEARCAELREANRKLKEGASPYNMRNPTPQANKPAAPGLEMKLKEMQKMLEEAVADRDEALEQLKELKMRLIKAQKSKEVSFMDSEESSDCTNIDTYVRSASPQRSARKHRNDAVEKQRPQEIHELSVLRTRCKHLEGVCLKSEVQLKEAEGKLLEMQHAFRQGMSRSVDGVKSHKLLMLNGSADVKSLGAMYDDVTNQGSPRAALRATAAWETASDGEDKLLDELENYVFQPASPARRLSLKEHQQQAISLQLQLQQCINREERLKHEINFLQGQLQEAHTCIADLHNVVDKLEKEKLQLQFDLDTATSTADIITCAERTNEGTQQQRMNTALYNREKELRKANQIIETLKRKLASLEQQRNSIRKSIDLGYSRPTSPLRESRSTSPQRESIISVRENVCSQPKTPQVQDFCHRNATPASGGSFAYASTTSPSKMRDLPTKKHRNHSEYTSMENLARPAGSPLQDQTTFAISMQGNVQISSPSKNALSSLQPNSHNSPDQHLAVSSDGVVRVLPPSAQCQSPHPIRGSELRQSTAGLASVLLESIAAERSSNNMDLHHGAAKSDKEEGSSRRAVTSNNKRDLPKGHNAERENAAGDGDSSDSSRKDSRWSTRSPRRWMSPARFRSWGSRDSSVPRMRDTFSPRSLSAARRR